MKKNLYYRTVYKRQNLIKSFLLNFFLVISSYPRLVIEVFIRRNMGERYFSLASSLTVAAILLLFPSITDSIVELFLPRNLRGFSQSYDNGLFATKNILYTIYVFAFIAFSILRYREVKRNPTVFDFKRFSMSTGYSLPVFTNLSGNSRLIETVFEPLPFFLGGLVLTFAGQSLGLLLIFCSICYSLSYMGAYYQGDQFVMDTIDEMIMNEETKNSFVGNDDPSETRGVRFFAKKPRSIDDRERLADAMIQEEADAIPEAS